MNEEGKKSYQSSYLLTFSREKNNPKHKPRNYCNHILHLSPATTKIFSQAISRKNRVNVRTCLCRESARILDRLSEIHLIYT